jgi:uncharacterized protein YggE
LAAERAAALSPIVTAREGEDMPESHGPPTIRVGATGEATGAPDRLTIDLGVVCRAPTARQALTRANERAAELIEMLGREGVAKNDIATRSISIHPHYDDKGKVAGYEASNDVVVVLRDLARAGEVIDAAAGATGDDIRMGALTFGIEDPSELLAEARQAAVRKATKQASELALAAGVALGPILRIVEGRDGAPPSPRPMLRAMAAESVPIEPGAQRLAVTVEIEWEIAGPTT